MPRNAALSFRALLILPLLAACSLMPDDGPEVKPSEKGPQFDAEYYAANAKDFIAGGQYGRAKHQWLTFLELQPGDWAGRLGIAFCDLYLAEEAVVQRGDFRQARTLLAGAEKTFAELQSGPLERDTQEVKQNANWKPALGAALAARYAGYMDHLEAAREEAAIARNEGDVAKRRETLAALRARREENYRRAIGVFERLAAMENASPEAVRNLGQLYLVTRQDAKAERELLRYLEFARSTVRDFEAVQEENKKDYQADRAAVVASLLDQKIKSNVAKQVQTLDDLAGLSFARGDYLESKKYLEEALTVDPERRDLYLKLAQSDGELRMYETALMRLDEFLRRSLRRREDFNEQIQRAMELKKQYEAKLAASK